MDIKLTIKDNTNGNTLDGEYKANNIDDLKWEKIIKDLINNLGIK